MSLVLLWGKRFLQVFPNDVKNMFKTSSWYHGPVCGFRSPETRTSDSAQGVAGLKRIWRFLYGCQTDSTHCGYVNTVKNCRTKTVELFVYGSSRQQQLNAARGFSINRCGSFEKRRSLIWWFGLKTAVTVCDVSTQTGLTGHRTRWSEPLTPGPEFSWGWNNWSCTAFIYCAVVSAL